MFTPVYGETSEELLKTPFESFIDYSINSITINFFPTNSIHDEESTRQIENAGEGIKKTFDLWIWLHEALVDAILFIASLFGVTFDKTIALLISFFIGTLLIAIGFIHFGKRFWKIAVVIIIAIIIISMIPIDNLKL